MKKLLLSVMTKTPEFALLESLIFGILLGLITAFLSYKAKFLSLTGAFAAFVLGSLIFGLGGLKWSVPLLVFFISSSLLSKARKHKNEDVEAYFEKSGQRDHMQVLSNGGLGGILVLLDRVQPHEIWYLLYIAIVSEACADTWATEIGTLRRTGTYNILNLKPVSPGVSGGVSAAGTTGAILGAAAVCLSAVFWIGNFTYLCIIVFAGFLGSLADSFLGATLQAQYECKICGKLTEKRLHCGQDAFLRKGFIWLNNDLINLFAGICGATFLILFRTLFPG